jgi:hypothetical protein
MNGIAPRFVRFSFALLGLVTLGWVLTGQAAKPAQQRFPLPTDWTHSHLIFSQPATVEQARLIGNEPRFWQQMERGKQRLLVRDQLSGASAPSFLPTAGTAQRLSATQRDWSVSLGSGGSVGAGNYPAKFSFSSTTADCTTDYVAFSTGLSGSGTQASIVAFNNLYSGCGGTVPSVNWAYNTAGGRIQTSPILSRDGTQLAFVQSDVVGNGHLVLLKWLASAVESVSSPGSPTPSTHPLYPACAAPCMTIFDLRSGPGTQTGDTTSSVFYDYTNDIAWVGDDQGWLHKFTGVFLGVPAEVRNATWPVQVNPTNPLPLSSPVHDRITGNVIVGGAGDGVLYRVDSSTGAVTASAKLDFGTGLVAGPVVDSGNGSVYVSASSDGSLGCSGGTTDCAAVYQLTTSFAAGATGNEVIVGTSTDPAVSTPNPLYNGAFDISYLTSANGTGNYYVCGNTGANPILYQIQIQAGVPTGIVVPVSALTLPVPTPVCSPVTDFSNPNASGGTAERLFVSVQNNGLARGCSSAGCVMSFVDTPWRPLTAYTVGQEILVFTTFNPNVLFIEVVIQAGTTAATPPTHWPTSAATVTINGSAHFMTQAGITAAPLNFWVANKNYALKNRVIDSNGNVEFVTVAGTSGQPTQPVWSTTAGTNTLDGTVTWLNLGAYAVSPLRANGGSSGIIIDNAVSSGTMPGASQVYFSTLADQLCSSGGTGGCAVQASQSALQ